MKPKTPQAPGHLSNRSQRLWGDIVSQGRWNGVRCEVLAQGLAALDRAEAAREAIDTEGMTAKTEKTGAIHANPLLRVEKDSRAQFFQSLEKLRLVNVAWN